MYYFGLYERFLFLFALLFSLGLILLAAAIFFSVRHYVKPAAGHSEADEHHEPGIPLVLKALYLGVAIYYLIATLYVALTGVAI